MIHSGEIIRITGGIYTFHKDVEVVGFAFQPFYYGLEDALSIRRLSLQGTNPAVITIRNIRRGTRKFGGRNYLVYNLDKRLFFGYELVKHGDLWIPVSDVEKTILDMLYFGICIRSEILAGIKERVDTEKVGRYLGRYPKRIRKKIAKELEGMGLPVPSKKK